MLAVISPAKKLDETPLARPLPSTTMALERDSRILLRTARARSQAELKDLMGISDALAALNHERFQVMSDTFTEDNAHQAATLFAGDTYAGLDARSLEPADLEWAQDHLVILSGLYGALRPLDLIQPYRLEMGTRLQTRRGSSLYDFWGDRITKVLNERTADHADRSIVNLASNEYFKAVQPKQLAGPVIEVRFLEIKPHKTQMISFLAKKARGAMARWIIENRVERAQDLRGFDQDRYRLDADQSTSDTLVFSREFISAADRR